MKIIFVGILLLATISGFANNKQMVLQPFTREVALGQLQEGKHTISYINGDGTLLTQMLTISRHGNP